MRIFAHRGASAVAPEGTRAAIRAAVQARADGIELDVQATRDGRLVIFHDERLERTTTGQGRLRDHSYAAIARLDAGRWFHARFAGERILPVERALAVIPKTMRVNLELKRTTAPALLRRRIRTLLAREGRRSRLLLSSFDPILMAPFRGWPIPRALICDRQPDRALRTAIQHTCLAWHPRASVVSRRRITTAHQAGLAVHVWTVDDPAHARWLRRLGVDGIFTNDPARMRRALA